MPFVEDPSGKLSVSKIDTQKVIKPAVVNSSVVKPGMQSQKKAPEIKGWDANVLPALERLGLDENSLFDPDALNMIRNAYNGNYYGVVKETEKDNPYLHQDLKKFQDYSFALGKELQKENPNQELIFKYYSQADTYMDKVSGHFKNSGNKGSWRLDETNGKILKDTEYKKKSQNTVIFDDENSSTARVTKSTSLSLITGLPVENVSLVDDTPAWTRYKTIEQKHQQSIKSQTNHFVSQWANQALVNAAPDNPNKVEFTKNAYDINKDLLSFVAKHGTSTDKDLSQQDKVFATSLLQQIKGKDLSQSVDILKNKTEKILDLYKRIGYYGNNYLFNKYKGSLGTNKSYYDYDSQSNISKKIEQIKFVEKLQKNYSDFGNIAQTVKTGAKEMALDMRNNNEYFKEIEGTDELFKAGLESLVNQKGNIVSFDKWLSNLNSAEKKWLVKNNESWWDRQKKEIATIPNAIKSQLGLSNKLSIDSTAYDYELSTFKDIYSNLSKGYKQMLDERKVKLSYPQTALINGFGASSQKGIGYESVDLRTTKEGSLLNFTGPKQENTLRFLQAIKTRDNQFRTDGSVLVLPSTVPINTIEKSDFSKYSENNQKTADSFFSKNPDDVQMVFHRNSNVKGYSLYKLKNNETKESISILVNQKLIGSKGVKEDMFMNSRETLEDINFMHTGKKELMERTDENGSVFIKKPHLVFNSLNGTYTGVFQIPINGNWVTKQVKDLPPGNLELSTKFFDEYLDKLIED